MRYVFLVVLMSAVMVGNGLHDLFTLASQKFV